MSGNGQPGKLDAYLDHQLSETERRAFEQLLEESPELRAEVELQRHVDETLRRRFAPPEAPPVFLKSIQQAHPVQLHKPADSARDSRVWQWTLAVGLIALASFLIYSNWPEDRLAKYRSQPLTEIYRESVASGFKPLWLCDNDHEFATTFQQRVGQPLVLQPLPSGSHMVGLTYRGGVSANTTCLMCRVDGEPVMVFVDRQAAERRGSAPKGADGLQVFRKDSGDLVFFEVTPFSTARVSDALVPIDAAEVESLKKKSTE